MDDFMDTLLKKEFAPAEIPDAGFSERVLRNAFKHDRERLALIIGGILAGALVALISVPDIISIVSALVNNITQAGVQSLPAPELNLSQPWFPQLKQALMAQSSILVAMLVALLAPVFLLVLED